MDMVYGNHMPTQKTTLYLDGGDYQRLKNLAYRRDCAPAFLVREAVAEYLTQHAPTRKPRSVGSGNSGLGDLAARADYYLDGMGAIVAADRPAGTPAKRRRRA